MYPNRPEKYEVVSFSNAFHGRTFAALSATPNTKYQKPFLPLMAGFKSLPFNDVASLDKIGENICAVIVEPVQGEGGIHAASKEFLRALRKKCDDVGALLIYDEIQVRLGRRLKEIELFLRIPTFLSSAELEEQGKCLDFKAFVFLDVHLKLAKQIRKAVFLPT